METLLSTATNTLGGPTSAASPEADRWHLRGACRGLESAIFYPDPTVEADVNRALVVCSGCDVRQICLENALINREMTGIWGGATERERRRILRQRGPA